MSFGSSKHVGSASLRSRRNTGESQPLNAVTESSYPNWFHSERLYKTSKGGVAIVHREARLWGLNHRLLISVLADCVDDFDAIGLDSKEFFVLAGVDEWPYPAELSSNLVIPKPTLSSYLRRLEADGLVERRIDRGDLRRHRLVLTSAGRKTLDAALDVLSRKFDRWLQRLTQDEQQELERLLGKVLTPEAEPEPEPEPGEVTPPARLS